MDPNTMYSVDLSGPPVALDMQAWMDDRDSVPRVVFAATHRVETFGTDGGRGPDPYLEGLRTGGWALLDDFAGWADPAPGWSAVLDVATDELTMSNSAGEAFYSGTLNSSPRWRKEARKLGMFIALAGDFADPVGCSDAALRSQLYAMLCPITINRPGRNP
ncbi:hypothetical protein EV284_6445 [Streptomyces sp. BK022]|uniref:hypothetical protein n=1 Tax=Streptomyces sp. BK022 TaxID=2512123 RepID=UPI00102A5B8E|nr:hypothetical protein [Streptomyces sp. BK022]RZU28279.1 hypothetical protein EV284_6445 [Streptomyces sp. BK022]